jgi:hypothetical protein
MMSPEAEQRYAEIVAENKARFDNPEFQRAARLFFSRMDWKQRQESPADKRKRRIATAWMWVITLAILAGGIWGVGSWLSWLERKTREAHPGEHWVRSVVVEGHWEKDTP